MTLARVFAEWAAAVDAHDLGADVRHAIARHVLDGVGNAIAGYHAGSVAAAVTVATAFHEPAEATIVGDGRLVPAAAAALANGTLMHALDFDDTHTAALVHPTAVIVPAVLAVAQRVGATGDDVIAAAAIGFEAIIRLGASVHHGFHAQGFHATSVCGAPAAALASAWLSGSDVPGAVNAMGIATSQSSGLLEFLHSDATTKQLHAGWAAHAGIMAADLAAAGATGPDSGLDGEYGLIRAFTREAGSDVSGDLGRRWELLGTTIKPYPACQLSHAALDALASVRTGFAVEEVEHIAVDVPSASVPIVCEPVHRKLAPATPYEAKFSMQWCLAALLIDGELTAASFDDDGVARADIRQLAARVEYRPYDPDGPPADAPGRVRVKLRNGQTVAGSVRRSRGGPDQPMTDEDLIEKFVANCGTPAATRVAHELLRLEEVRDMDSLLDLVNQAANPAAT
jgi:2-methylcitrate dehydratase PrpD